MFNVTELRTISAARLEDAQALLDAGRYDGAAYLCGYAVELALKARICETLNWAGFPSTNREFRDLQSLRTHNLNVLLRLSGQDNRIREDMPEIWKAVASWSPDLRYRRPSSVSESAAALLLAQMRSVMESIW